jgi:hypothetical protein
MAKAEQVLWYLNILLTVALLAGMLAYRLRRAYPWLFWYWLSQAAVGLTLLFIPLRSDLYANTYYFGQSLTLVLSVFAIHELFRLALAGHPGLSAFSRRGLLLVLGGAAILALAGMGLDVKVLPGHYSRVQRFLSLDRTVQFVLLMFLVSISGFLVWFPVRIRRNVAVYIAGFVLFFGSQSFALLLYNRLPRAFSKPVSVAALAFSLLCSLLWLLGMRRESEAARTVVGHGWNPVAAARLAAQLNGINTALARFARSAPS